MSWESYKLLQGNIKVYIKVIKEKPADIMYLFSVLIDELIIKVILALTELRAGRKNTWLSGSTDQAHRSCGVLHV